MVITSFIIFGLAFVVLIRTYIIDEQKDSVESTAQEVGSFLGSMLEDSSGGAYDYVFSGFNIVLSTFMKISSNNIMIADANGVITACSDGFICEHMYRQLNEDILKASFNQDMYSIQGTLGDLYQTPHYSVVKPMRYLSGGVEDIRAYVITSSDASSYMDMWGSLAAMFLFVGIAVVIISFFIAMLMARWQTAPMRQMSVMANKFASGDFSVRVENNNRSDELGELMDSFNAMADSLEKSENQRKEFIANVSHELKTPMTSINGFAEGILDGTIPSERQDEYLQIIASETKRLSRLVRNMLDSSKIEAMGKDSVLSVSFDLAEVLRKSLLGLEKKINDKHLDVKVEIPDGVVLVKGQEDAITQVVNNLLDNGIKFSEEGGALGLRVSRMENKILVAIENTGRTIPREELPLIFDRFHKIDRSRNEDKDGVGLGLHIVKKLINNHGEKIYVKSENGVTEFVFTLTPYEV